jgi:hypothetical protein
MWSKGIITSHRAQASSPKGNLTEILHWTHLEGDRLQLDHMALNKHHSYAAKTSETTKSKTITRTMNPHLSLNPIHKTNNQFLKKTIQLTFHMYPQYI